MKPRRRTRGRCRTRCAQVAERAVATARSSTSGFGALAALARAFGDGSRPVVALRCLAAPPGVAGVQAWRNHESRAGPGRSGPALGGLFPLVADTQISERCFRTNGNLAQTAPSPRRLPVPKAATTIRTRASSTWSSTSGLTEDVAAPVAVCWAGG